MCGIVATISKQPNGFSKKQEDVFYDMLFSNTLRGDDSTGVICVMNNQDFGIMKDAWAAPHVIQYFQGSAMGRKMFSMGKAIIGHNRKATIGKVEKETAHPFLVGNKFALVHNGTLYNHHELANTVVDSEALAIHLSKVLNSNFELSAFEEAIGKVRGAYAVLCYSQETNCVYAFRNKERPLSVFETGQGWHIGSEFGMVGWCSTRNGETIIKDGANYIKEDCLYTFDLTKNTLTKQDYVPKKAMPPMAATHTHTPSRTEGGSKYKWGSGMSKNEFKRLRRKHLNRYIQFYADDYVEKYFPRTLADGETLITLMGENDYFGFDHFVTATFDITDFPVGDTEITDRLYMGFVDDMVWDMQAERVVFMLTRCRTVPKPLLENKHENSPAVH